MVLITYRTIRGQPTAVLSTSEADPLPCHAAVIALGSPGISDKLTYVLIRCFCSVFWGTQGWGRAKGGERELAKG